MFKSSARLSDTQLHALYQLANHCRQADESLPNFYPHLLSSGRPLPASGLYYQGDLLIGFIGLFFFGEAHAEVALLVRPDYRRQGIAGRMLHEMSPLLAQQRIKSLSFSAAKTHRSWLHTKGLRYQYSEYRMIWHASEVPGPVRGDVSFRLAQKKDINALLNIQNRCFHEEETELFLRYLQLLSDKQYEFWLLCQGARTVGKAHIRWQGDKAIFSDIGILPPFQGKGYGSALLRHCMNHCVRKGKNQIELDVEARNTQALKLYQNLGFEIGNACDYWLTDSLLTDHCLPLSVEIK